MSGGTDASRLPLHPRTESSGAVERAERTPPRAGSSDPAHAGSKSAGDLESERALLRTVRDAQEALFHSLRSAEPAGSVAARTDALAHALRDARTWAGAMRARADVPDAHTSASADGTTERNDAALRAEVDALRAEIRASAARSLFLARKASAWLENQVHWLVETAEQQGPGATYGPPGTAARKTTRVSSGLDRSA